MNALKILICGAFAVFFSANAALAQNEADAAERLQVAQQFAELFVLDQLIDQLLPTMSAEVEDLLGQQPGANPDKVKAFSKRFAELAGERLRADMEPMTVKLMADNFTKAELQAAFAFYSTPEGRSIRDKMPIYMSEVMKTVVPYIQKLGPELVEQVVGEMQAKEEAH